MLFKRMIEYYYYYKDSFFIKSLDVKIEFFQYDQALNIIKVIYRLGKKKLFHKMPLTLFETQYFEKISHYDQLRLTKYSTLQLLLQALFCNNFCSKEEFIKYIKAHLKNEQQLL